MNDQQIIDSYCITPEVMQSRYKALYNNGRFFPITPAELAAVLVRLNDGTINKVGATRVIDELERRNKVFIKFVHTL